MDPATLATTVTALLVPYLAKAGASLADEAVKRLPEAVGGVWQAITQRFKAKPGAEAAANDLTAKADDADNQELFELQLKRLLKDDPDFAEQIGGLLEKAQASVNIKQGAGSVGIVGNVSGNVVLGSNPTTIDANSGTININQKPK
jgi:hypothetical protein